MPTSISPKHQKRIAEATALLEVAQRDLESVVGQLQGGEERANKTMITAVLQKALEKVAVARANLQQVLEE